MHRQMTHVVLERARSARQQRKMEAGKSDQGPAVSSNCRSSSHINHLFSQSQVPQISYDRVNSCFDQNFSA